MSVPVISAALWAVAATFVALLPMRRQFVPGLALLIAAPGLILWLGAQHGWGWSFAAALGFVSMFRRPLAFIARRMTGGSRE
ncbi:DUF2484 family protein [Jhaorihella thermophila]|uniref:UDP-N-acetylmuramate--alanine ligase n=1 Tax=Jhaorihella thermophila TaxID=488547 RepID=A0A1H5TYG7_9RHOB|nr:DUF2484 family protein [Jhaorihella thermophila]SEF67780.1 Protein of unknown function [Jhaorihella thermophila]